MLTSFNLHFLENIKEEHSPHDFPVEQGHSVSPHKVWRDLFLTAVHGRWWTNFLAVLLGDCSTWVNDCIMPSEEEFQESSLKTVNLKIFTNRERIYT